MSRVEENKKLNLPNSFRDDIQVQIAQAKFLEDISRSLAIIADSVTDNSCLSGYNLTVDEAIMELKELKSEAWVDTRQGTAIDMSINLINKINGKCGRYRLDGK